MLLYVSGMNTTRNTDGLKYTTVTAIRVSDAARSADGDYRATERALARFCTEALVEVATGLPRPDFTGCARERAVYALTVWANKERLAAWSRNFRAEQDMYAALGAVI